MVKRWNAMVRLYRRRADVLSVEWSCPEAQAVGWP
jgi:hypothetical protein